METKHLAEAKPATVVKLKTTERVEVEVPAGSFWYQLPRQTGGTRHYIFHLRHKGSEIKVTGLVNAKNNRTPSLKTEVIHHAPHTKAETLIRTLSQDTAAPRYEGLIKITKRAQQCESYLNHHALLLGDQASNWSLPSLEIDTNEVKCSHAATVRTLTDQDLFYLRSRGVDRQKAQQTLVDAFLSDV